MRKDDRRKNSVNLFKTYIKEANINLIYIGRARGNFLLSTTDAQRQANLANIKKYSDALNGYLEKARPLFVTAEAKALFVRYENDAMAYEKTMSRVLALGAKAPFLERSAELSAATQQNAALVEEAAAAAASLNEQARALLLNVEIFKLGTVARTAHAEPFNALPPASTTRQLVASRQIALLH